MTDSAQREALQVAIDAGTLRAITIDNVATLEVFAELVATMRSSETACLSRVQTRGWLIASIRQAPTRADRTGRIR